MLQPVNPSETLDIARLCAASYNDNPSGSGWYDFEDMRVGVQSVNDTTVVVFRGSYNIRNWVRDLFVVPKKSWDGFWIHGGVADGVTTLMPHVLPLVNDLKNIVVAGHSLGGGFAREFGRKLNCTAVTFGALKTDFRFGPMPVNNHVRIICSDDPVPWVPGTFYIQDCDPHLVLKDPDGTIVNPADHCMDVYIKRLEATCGAA